MDGNKTETGYLEVCMLHACYLSRSRREMVSLQLPVSVHDLRRPEPAPGSPASIRSISPCSLRMPNSGPYASGPLPCPSASRPHLGRSRRCGDCLKADARGQWLPLDLGFGTESDDTFPRRKRAIGPNHFCRSGRLFDFLRADGAVSVSPRQVADSRLLVGSDPIVPSDPRVSASVLLICFDTERSPSQRSQCDT